MEWLIENPGTYEGEGAPWKAPGLAPLVVSVLPGLSSTRGPPLAAERLSDGGQGVVHYKIGLTAL